MRYAHTWFLLFRGPLLYRVQPPLRLRQSWQPAVVRRIHRLGSPEKGRAGLQECASAVPAAKPVL